MLLGELAGQRVDIPDPLDRDEEGLVGRQARRAEIGYLVSQVVLKLVGVRRMNGARLLEAGPPLSDQGFESVVDAGKLAAASPPPFGPTPAPWC